MLLNLAETVVSAQIENQGSKLFVADTAAELAIERVPGHFLEWIFIDLFEGTMQFWQGWKKRMLCRIDMRFEPDIRFIARA